MGPVACAKAAQSDASPEPVFRFVGMQGVTRNAKQNMDGSYDVACIKDINLNVVSIFLRTLSRYLFVFDVQSLGLVFYQWA